MPHRKLRILVAAALVLSGARWLVDSNAWSGPVVLRLTRAHGVHLNDWVGVACFGLAAVLVLAGRGGATATAAPQQVGSAAGTSVAARATEHVDPATLAEALGDAPTTAPVPATLAEALGGAAPAAPLPVARPSEAPVVEQPVAPAA